MVNAPPGVANNSKSKETSSNSKRRQHSDTYQTKSYENEVEEDEEEEESDEEDDQVPYSQYFAYPPAAAPYGYSPYHGHYPHYQNSAYGPYQQGFSVPTPKKTKKSKKNNSASSSNSIGPNMDVDRERAPVYDVNEDEEDEEALQTQTPKAKRPKLKDSAVRDDQAIHSYGPFGLQAPNMGDVPMGFQSGYPPSAPSLPSWWSQSPGHWQMPSSASNTPDSATLWAYYYYGYAMGQYDALKFFSKKKRSHQ